jgi:ankyrin repeat protein
MKGTDQIRFCSHCAKDVNNLSEMTRKQAARLVRRSNGNLCIRYIANPVSKRPMFAEQLLQITRRRPGIAAGVVSASLSLSTLNYAQGGSMSSERAQVLPAKAVSLKASANDRSDRSSVLGSVMDPNGAVIPNAVVILTNENASDTKKVTSNAKGEYKFEDVAAGSYLIDANAQGFQQHTARLVVSGEPETRTDIGLNIRTIEITVDVVSDVDFQTVVAGGIGMTEYSSPLHRAVADDDLEKARDLINKGANVNGKDENYDKITPLFVAVENANVEMVRLLLEFGAKVNAREGQKQTPLMHLDDDATPELVDLLIRYGAEIDLIDKEGNSALILAAEGATPEVIRALIDAGADVNRANKEGQTALMNAAENDDIECVRVLIMANAKVNAKNKEGESAIDLTSDTDIEKLLISYGAKSPESSGSRL